MSISWFITPYDPKHWEDPNDTREKPVSDLYIDFFIYYQSLLERWPEATIDRDGDSSTHYQVENPDGSWLRINLYQKNQVVSINNNQTESFFDFILFHRNFVSDEYDLYFFNSSAWESLQLNKQTTIQDIKQFSGFRD